MANVRTVLNLTPEAIEAIERNAPSPNKKGEWASMAVVEYDRINRGIGTLGDEDDGILERIDSRLARLEKQLAVLMGKA